MPLVWDLITDNNSMEGKLVTTVVIVAIAIVVGTLVGRVWSRRIDDRYRKYYARKIIHYVVVAVTLIGLGILWRPFAGQLGLVLGLMAAGIAIGLQGSDRLARRLVQHPVRLDLPRGRSGGRGRCAR